MSALLRANLRLMLRPTETLCVSLHGFENPAITMRCYENLCEFLRMRDKICA